MIAIKTILLPTDGSECSGKAMAYALSFAKQYGARIVALHVIDRRWEDQTRVTFAELGQDLTQKIRKGYEEEAGRILHEAAEVARKAGVPVETRTLTGIPFEEIVRAGEELSADLIIMGTHGRTGMSHLLLGSVAEKVVRKAPCPVLTVRPEEHDVVLPQPSGGA
jgi:nucleotide-binding universal stress UspA family protein